MRRAALPALSALLALFAAGCLFVPTSSDVDYAPLTVEVLDTLGVPVPDARVEIHGGWYRTGRRNVGTTGAGGTVTFSLPPWFYDIYVEPPAGYAHLPGTDSTHTRIELRREINQNPPRNVTLVVSPAPAGGAQETAAAPGSPLRRPAPSADGGATGPAGARRE